MPDSSLLQTLGRRVERLFFLGLTLIALCFWDLYLTTANLQFSQNRSLVAINSILSDIQSKQSHYEDLFNTKPEPQPPPINPALLEERTKRIAATRKMLGLPPAVQKQPEKKQEVPTYADELKQVFETAITTSGAPRQDIIQYQDSTIPPAELIKKLNSVKTSLEAQTTSVWGIQTPRLVKLNIGVDYEFPYAFLANVITVISAPLVFGWLRLLYVTRRREIFEILKTDDFRMTFPHILNFVPIRLRTPPPTPQVIAAEPVGRIILATTRVAVILTFVAPILYAQYVSLLQLGLAVGRFSWAIDFGVGFSFLSFALSLVLVGQEFGFLITKQFVEA